MINMLLRRALLRRTANNNSTRALCSEASAETGRRRRRRRRKKRGRDACVLVKVSAAPGGAHTELHWGDAHVSTFHNSWLRDHCQCQACLDPATMQRSFDSLQLGPLTASYAETGGGAVRGSSRTALLSGAWEASAGSPPPPPNSKHKAPAAAVLELEMNTDDGSSQHSLQFSVPWLRENCYSAGARSERAAAAASSSSSSSSSSWDPRGLSAMAVANGDACAHGVDVSDAGGLIPSTHFDALALDPLRLRRQLHTYGIAFITDPGTKSLRLGHDGNLMNGADDAVHDPTADSRHKQLVERTVRSYLGFPRETIWGTTWDTAVVEPGDKDDDRVRDTAYTNVALRNHVDCTYLRDPPQLQVFLCSAESDDAAGGVSTFQDGFRVADELFKVSPEAFWFFATTKLGFQCTHDGVDTLSYAPVFELDTAFEAHFVGGQGGGSPHVRPPLRRFRYNNDDRAVINHLPAQSVDAFYRHLPLLLELLRRKDLTLRKRLRQGDWVIVDNHRVLHGRTAFSGSGRKFVGCYAEMDEASFV
jgi:alpha-ketoglutarate-dependent taurine dioxygenase